MLIFLMVMPYFKISSLLVSFDDFYAVVNQYVLVCIQHTKNGKNIGFKAD